MKHQKIIDDLMKLIESRVWRPINFPAYRAAREFRTAEQRKTIDQIERELYPPLCAKPAAYMNVHKTYFDGAGRERDGHGHIIMRAADHITDAMMFGTGITKTTGQWSKVSTYGGKLAENACQAEQMIADNDLLKPLVQHMHRSIVEKFFGLWEGALQPRPKWHIVDQAIDTSKPAPACFPSYENALRWPGLYQ